MYISPTNVGFPSNCEAIIIIQGLPLNIREKLAALNMAFITDEMVLKAQELKRFDEIQQSVKSTKIMSIS